MSYIPDLASVSYMELVGPIRAVGWLESPHLFTRGPVAPEFARRLMALIERPIWAYFSRGFYKCSLCEAEDRCGPNPITSQAVLLVPSPSCVYETPIWIGHYVLGHSYQPPVEFCNAVMSCPEPGSNEFRETLIASLPELSMVALDDRPFFKDWAEGARRTLQPDPEYGSKEFREEAKPSPSQQHERDLQFYNSLSSEDPQRPCKKDGCRRGAIRHSVFCRKHHFEQIEHRECPFDY